MLAVSNSEARCAAGPAASVGHCLARDRCHPVRRGADDRRLLGDHVCFFFQAEDGIRDYKVTRVQTCALPIWRDSNPRPSGYEPANAVRPDASKLFLERNRRATLTPECVRIRRRELPPCYPFLR